MNDAQHLAGKRGEKHQPGERAPAAAPKLINLALQGGGTHGAFTWGALDRLLEDERIMIDGISATSAGAMNAAVVAYGWTIGGRAGARSSLAAFWERIGNAGAFCLLQPTLVDRLISGDSLRFSPVFAFVDLATRLFSPYELNPLNLNPLRDVVGASVDFEVLRTGECPIKLFISATNVRTGKIKIFERHELSADRVMASACLPLLFQAVEVDGEHYWDGGYMGNPAMFPLIYNCACRDIVVIRINPLQRQKLPRTAADILNRINEITFNSSLMREMRAVSFVTELIDAGMIKDDALTRMLIHSIAGDEELAKLGAASKFNADRQFLRRLRDAGRRQADNWLAANFDLLGAESTIDLQKEFL